MGENTTDTTTRRSVLGRLALVVGGAVGLGVAGKGAIGDAAAPAVATPRIPRELDLVLYGRDWRIQRPSAEPGKLPGPTDAAVPAGRIVDTRQRDVGGFSAAALPGFGAAFQIHTFDLVDGTILGIGAARLEEGTYAIVGGTGRYAGATGAYTARQSPANAGGDGTAEFRLNLKAWEA